MKHGKFLIVPPVAALLLAGCANNQAAPTISQAENIVDTQTRVIGQQATAIHKETAENITRERAGTIITANDTIREEAIPGIKAAEKQHAQDQATIKKLESKNAGWWTFAAIAGVAIFAGGVGLCFVSRSFGIPAAAVGMSLSIGIAAYQALLQFIPWLVGAMVLAVLAALAYLFVKYRKYIAQLVQSVDAGLNSLAEPEQKKFKTQLAVIQDTDTKSIVDKIQGK